MSNFRPLILCMLSILNQPRWERLERRSGSCGRSIAARIELIESRAGRPTVQSPAASGRSGVKT